ncbi:MAG: N-acetyltransferase [Candidatus Electrothrix sp. AX5]|nr:N-acetyltransferase [Candidatus Electrothrix sp. AX5]
MSQDIIYRKARISDLDQISKVDVFAFGKYSYPRFFLRQAFDILGGLLEIAESESKSDCIIGYTLGAINIDDMNEGWIISLAVTPTFQQAGIGKELTKNVLKNLSNRHIKDVYLTVKPGNIPATSLYKGLGFEEDKYDDSYFGTGEGRVLMVKKILE